MRAQYEKRMQASTRLTGRVGAGVGGGAGGDHLCGCQAQLAAAANAAFARSAAIRVVIALTPAGGVHGRRVLHGGAAAGLVHCETTHRESGLWQWLTNLKQELMD